MFCFEFCSPKAAEAVNSKMTGWRSSELIGYVDLMIFREIWSEHSTIDKEQMDVGEFFYFKFFLMAASNATRYDIFSMVEFDRSIKR